MVILALAHPPLIMTGHQGGTLCRCSGWVIGLYKDSNSSPSPPSPHYDRQSGCHTMPLQRLGYWAGWVDHESTSCQSYEIKLLPWTTFESKICSFSLLKIKMN